MRRQGQEQGKMREEEKAARKQDINREKKYTEKEKRHSNTREDKEKKSTVK